MFIITNGTEGKVAFTAEEFEAIANHLRRFGGRYMGSATLALNLADNEPEVSGKIEALVHPDAAKLFNQAHYQMHRGHGIVGYAYDADTHCEACAFERFGLDLLNPDTQDSEGNAVHPIHNWDESAPEDVCGDCFGLLM